MVTLFWVYWDVMKQIWQVINNLFSENGNSILSLLQLINIPNEWMTELNWVVMLNYMQIQAPEEEIYLYSPQNFVQK